MQHMEYANLHYVDNLRSVASIDSKHVSQKGTLKPWEDTQATVEDIARKRAFSYLAPVLNRGHVIRFFAIYWRNLKYYCKTS